MIFAVDSNVLLDVFTDDPDFADLSIAALADASSKGELIACDVVFAETSSTFASQTVFQRQMSALGIRFVPTPESAALKAGAIWRAYLARTKRRAGVSRKGVVPDFLVGAHALACADALITRDRGFLRDYFTGLKLVDPSQLSA